MAVAHHHEREVTFDVPAGWALPELGDAVPTGGRPESATHELSRRLLRHRPGPAPPARHHPAAPRGRPRRGVAPQAPRRRRPHRGPQPAPARSVPTALARRLAGITAGAPSHRWPRSTPRGIRCSFSTPRESFSSRSPTTRSRPPSRRRCRPTSRWCGGRSRSSWDRRAASATSRRSAPWCEPRGATRSAQQRKINHVLGEPARPGRRRQAGAGRGLPAGAVPGRPARRRHDARRPHRSGRASHPGRRPPAAHHGCGCSRIRWPLSAAELDRIDAELRWLAGLLSPVRDADVLGVRLDRELGRLAGERRGRAGAATRSTARSRDDRAAGLRHVARAQRDGERYRRLMADLGTWFLGSPVRADERVRPRAVLRPSRADGPPPASRGRRRRRPAPGAQGGQTAAVCRGGARARGRRGQEGGHVGAPAAVGVGRAPGPGRGRGVPAPAGRPEHGAAGAQRVHLRRPRRPGWTAAAGASLRRQATLSRWAKTTTLSR